MKKIQVCFLAAATLVLLIVAAHIVAPEWVDAQQRKLVNGIHEGRSSYVAGELFDFADNSMTPNADGTESMGVTGTRWDQIFADELFGNKGADVASAANGFTLGADGNYYDITGTTGLDSIAAQAVGKVVILQFDDVLTMTDGGNLDLEGNFVTAAGSHIILVSDGTKWHEAARRGGNVALEGNVTISGDLDIDGVLTVDGINRSAIVVTDAATYTLLAANTGMVHLIGDLSQNTDIDFPAEAAGLEYHFIYIGGAADAHDHTFDTGANANFFIGGFGFLDTDAGDAADEVNIGVFSDGNSNSKFLVNNVTAGSRFSYFCDGTNWHVSGTIYSDTVPTFADQ